MHGACSLVHVLQTLDVAAWAHVATCLLHQGLGRRCSRLRRSSIAVAEVVGLLVDLRHDELAPCPAVCQRLAVAVELPALTERGKDQMQTRVGVG